MKDERLEFPDRKITGPPAGTVGVREYARRRTAAGFPLSHTAVGKAIASGRIAAAVWRDERGRPFINPDLADELLAENTDPASQRENPKGGRPAAEGSDGLFADGGPEAESVRTPGAKGQESPALAFTRSRAAREAFEAQLARLRYQKETGDLVRTDLVRERCETVAILVRDSLLNIPARISGELAAETSAVRIEERLTNEIDRALEGLAELARPLT